MKLNSALTTLLPIKTRAEFAYASASQTDGANSSSSKSNPNPRVGVGAGGGVFGVFSNMLRVLSTNSLAAHNLQALQTPSPGAKGLRGRRLGFESSCD